VKSKRVTQQKNGGGEIMAWKKGERGGGGDWEKGGIRKKSLEKISTYRERKKKKGKEPA